MNFEYLGQQDFDQFLKKLSGKDRLTIKFYWKTACRRKELMVIRRLANFVGVYLIPPNRWEESKYDKRYHRAYLFQFVTPNTTYIFVPEMEKTLEPESAPEPEIKPPARKRGRPKKERDDHKISANV